MTIDDKIRKRIAKINELANRGVDGEKDAAKTQLEKLLKKYNINPQEVDEITKKEYFFKYANNLDKDLFFQLLYYFFKESHFQVYLHTFRKREISVKLDYLDYITISCAYEYFKRHMRREWEKFSAESIRRKRKTKTKNELRRNLQSIFYGQYILRSGIYHANQIKERSGSEITDTEWEHFNKLQEIQGGQYRTQVEKETLKIE